MAGFVRTLYDDNMSMVVIVTQGGTIKPTKQEVVVFPPVPAHG
jgi:hypothetical protein